MFGCTTTRPVFQLPMGCKNLFCLSAFIRSYSEANVLLPARPILASGCNVSSSTWYSSPIAELSDFSSRVTKYFTPLFAPGVNLNSNDKSKALYSSLDTMSPPPPACLPSEDKTVILPLLISHPFSGKRLLNALTHP